MSLADAPRLSVVIATHDRPALLARLLRQLGDQGLPRQDYEVVVVDDGSEPPVRPVLAQLALPIAVRLEEQSNAGAAAARHRGIQAARGEILVLLDDDMQVGPDFLAQHARHHRAERRVVALGRILADPDASMPLFERWHSRMIDNLWSAADKGAEPKGGALYSGNVSLRRLDYLAVGGFDPSLGHSEDVELGLRLQKAGVSFEWCETALSVHSSDHASLHRWRERSFEYGAWDHRIARKHPDLSEADPWRFLFELHPVSRPLMAAAVVAPALARPLSLLAYGAAAGLDALGAEEAAMAGVTLAFGLEYFRGLRREAGALPDALSELAAYGAARFASRGRPAHFARALEDLRRDQAAMRRYELKYGHPAASQGRLAPDLVRKIGLQILAGYRLMRALRASGATLAAMAVSRGLRHLYGSDLHWDAELAPGVMIVHGFGLAISHAARVGPGCILFQNVTLGMGTDPSTRASGAPILEANVHVGPGATLLGPITVGAGSKLMAGVVLTRSVPPRSLVAAPVPEARARPAASRKAGGERRAMEAT